MIRGADALPLSRDDAAHEAPAEALERDRQRLLEENARLRQELRDHATVEHFGNARGNSPHGSLADRVGAFERRLIEEALTVTGGIRSQAARLLRTTERILSYRIRRYGIDIRRFR
jgi:transcriptional regulator with GAF, ATPase, and Fis domain